MNEKLNAIGNRTKQQNYNIGISNALPVDNPRTSIKEPSEFQLLINRLKDLTKNIDAEVEKLQYFGNRVSNDVEGNCVEGNCAEECKKCSDEVEPYDYATQFNSLLNKLSVSHYKLSGENDKLEKLFG